jgi:hypothetical protein
MRKGKNRKKVPTGKTLIKPIFLPLFRGGGRTQGLGGPPRTIDAKCGTRYPRCNQLAVRRRSTSRSLSRMPQTAGKTSRYFVPPNPLYTNVRRAGERLSGPAPLPHDLRRAPDYGSRTRCQGRYAASHIRFADCRRLTYCDFSKETNRAFSFCRKHRAILNAGNR